MELLISICLFLKGVVSPPPSLLLQQVMRHFGIYYVLRCQYDDLVWFTTQVPDTSDMSAT